MNRLECIKSMVSKCNTAADIGTDHGYIVEMLLRDNTAENVIATDLNKGPLKKAIDYLTERNLNNKCDFRLGSGLTVLNKNEADTIIIAGMGGELISEIIETSKEIALEARQLILQPMTGIDKLRHYLYENGFNIIDESIVKEYHHYYIIIKAVPGKVNVEDEIYYEISIHLLQKNDIIIQEYINKIIDTNNKIIDNLIKTNNPEYKEKISNLKHKNKKVMELIKK